MTRSLAPTRGSPSKMAEILQSFKDPEVLAKAKEVCPRDSHCTRRIQLLFAPMLMCLCFSAQMLADPEYMRAAKKKMEQLKAKARMQGLEEDAAGIMQAMMGRAI